MGLPYSPAIPGKKLANGRAWLYCSMTKVSSRMENLGGISGVLYHGSMTPGIAWIMLSFWLGCVKKIEPFYTYFYLFAWAGFLGPISRRLRVQTGRWPAANA